MNHTPQLDSALERVAQAQMFRTEGTVTRVAGLAVEEFALALGLVLSPARAWGMVGQ